MILHLYLSVVALTNPKWQIWTREIHFLKPPFTWNSNVDFPRMLNICFEIAWIQIWCVLYVRGLAGCTEIRAVFKNTSVQSRSNTLSSVSHINELYSIWQIDVVASIFAMIMVIIIVIIIIIIMNHHNHHHKLWIIMIMNYKLARTTCWHWPRLRGNERKTPVTVNLIKSSSSSSPPTPDLGTTVLCG